MGKSLGGRGTACWRPTYLDGELPAATMQHRLAAIVAGAGLEPLCADHLRLLSSDTTESGLPDLGTEDGQREIDAARNDHTRRQLPGDTQ